MKTIKNIIIASMVLLGLYSCNFEDINRNPNKLQFGSVQPYNCFEPLTYGIGSYIQNYNRFWNNELIQVTAFTSGATRQEHMYQITPSNWQGVWDCYARFGGDANHMIDLAVQNNDKYYEAIGLIFKVYCLSNLADLFGEIPYSEAYMQHENRTPKFDEFSVLYGEFLADLEKANVILASKPTISKTGIDGIYGDNHLLWQKLANSLKVRILCRISGTDEAAWTKIQNIIDNPDTYPIFTSNADNAQVNFKSEDPYKSYWGAQKLTASQFQEYRITQQFVKMTTELDGDYNTIYADPRLSILAQQRGGKWKGTIAGCTESEKNAADNGSGYLNSDVINRDNMPAFIMDYSEILFILAEGVQKGKLNCGKTDKELYEAAVFANMEKISPYYVYGNKLRAIKTSDIDTFLDSSLGSYDKAGTSESIYSSKEELLLSQKWFSLTLVGFEQYHEWRRTEYPVLTIGDGTQMNDYELPTRFGYPNLTVSSNKANVEEALSRMGGANDMHTALPWSYKKLNGGSHRNPHPNQK